METANADRVRKGIERLQRTGEFSLLGEVPDDFVWDLSTYAGWPEDPEYQGVDGVRRFMRDWLETWSEWRLELEQVVESGDHVVALCRQRGIAKASGVPAEAPVGQVWTFRGTRPTRMRMYATHEEALTAAGGAGAAP